MTRCRTARTCASSQPMRIASSSASCASCRISSRFWFSTLIFSTQDTGFPSGVRHTWPPLPLAVSPTLSSLLDDICILFRGLVAGAAAVGADHELVDQIRQIYGALHVADALASSQHLCIAADIQQDVVVAQQAIAGHHCGSVLG